MTLRKIYPLEIVGDPSRTSTRRNISRLDWQTCLSASNEAKALFPALAAWAFDAELIFDRGKPIRLKDTAGDLVDYPETRETLRLRGALEPINTYLKELQIELPGVEHQGRHLRVGDSLILPVPGNGLHRIFSRESFACHGRAYGWWQNIPKKVRCDLLIDGETTAEADYTALHPTILYCKRGLKFDGDPYDVGDFPRDHVKQGFNIAVNSPNRHSDIGERRATDEGTRETASARPPEIASKFNLQLDDRPISC